MEGFRRIIASITEWRVLSIHSLWTPQMCLFVYDKKKTWTLFCKYNTSKQSSLNIWHQGQSEPCIESAKSTKARNQPLKKQWSICSYIRRRITVNLCRRKKCAVSLGEVVRLRTLLPKCKVTGLDSRRDNDYYLDVLDSKPVTYYWVSLSCFRNIVLGPI